MDRTEGQKRKKESLETTQVRQSQKDNVRATDTTKAVRVFDTGSNLGLILVKVVEYRASFASHDFLAPSLSRLANVEHLGSFQMSLAGITSFSAFHGLLLLLWIVGFCV